MSAASIQLRHNLAPDEFVWLWAKYATGFNPDRHCTNCLRGRYSKVFSKASNPSMANDRTLNLDEQPPGTFDAIYLCGVAKRGYSARRNYPLNLHSALIPKPGAEDQFTFLHWKLWSCNATFLRIPAESEIPALYRNLAPEYVTCRIFRWASAFYSGMSQPARLQPMHLHKAVSPDSNFPIPTLETVGPSDSGVWLKSEEVRRRFRLSTCELMHLRESGKIRFEKRGNAFFYRVQDLGTTPIDTL
jgi:hypothetical protein